MKEDSNKNGRLIKVDFSSNSDKELPESTARAMEMMDEIIEMFEEIENPPIAMMYVQDAEDSVCLRGNTDMEHVPLLLANALVTLLSQKLVDKETILTICIGLLENIGVKITRLSKKNGH